MNQIKNWQSVRSKSSKQLKSKKTPRRLQAWQEAHNVLVQRLREGIGGQKWPPFVYVAF